MRHESNTQSKTEIENTDLMNLFSQFAQPSLKCKEQLFLSLFEEEELEAEDKKYSFRYAINWAEQKVAGQKALTAVQLAQFTKFIKTWKPKPVSFHFLLPASKN
ncbi:MAG: hypothetical protein ABUT20_54715 [Bacteroidota bacterium]